MSQNSDATTNATESTENKEESIVYNVDDYVEIQGKKNTRKGYIRFKGKIEAFGDCVGIELDEKIKEGNDGKLENKEYFSCQLGKGTFVKLTKIIKKLDPPKPKTKPKATNDDNKNTENKEDDSNKDSFPKANLESNKSEELEVAQQKKKKKKGKGKKKKKNR
eukprot:73599_1